MRIGDNFAFHIRPPFPDPARAGRQAIMGTYCLTPEARSVCSEILQRIVGPSARPAVPLLLTGHPGVGKTHLLRYLMALLENPEDAAWNAPLFPELPKPDRALAGLYLSFPEDPSQDLAASLLQGARNRGSAGTEMQARHTISYLRWNPRDFAVLLLQAAASAASPPLGLLVLDDVARRFRRLGEHDQARLESDLIASLVRVCSEKGVLVILAGDEAELRDRVPACESIRLRRTNVAQIISGALASKDAQQRARILRILNALREKLPSLGPSLETMADLYPIHPFVFQALFEIRSRLPHFALLQFVQIAIKASRTRPADRLVAVDWLFDYIAPDLKEHGEYSARIQAYEELQRTAIPRLPQPIQARALELLKAIALFTICNLRPATVTNLADALLIYDPADTLPSYALTAAVLGELELHGGGYLTAEGTLRDRRYSLAQKASPPRDRELLEPQEFRLCIPLMLYDWFHSQFRSWKPDTSAEYRRSSQSLAVTAQVGKRSAPGLVHFKNYFDPLWSEADLAAVQNASYEWILLMLAPFERFYELDAAARELAARSPRLIIWRPDSPTAEESEQLQELAGLKLFGADGAVCPDPSMARAREALRGIFTELYVQRGKLIIGKEQFLLRDRMAHQSLEEFLLSRLQAILSPSAPRSARPAESLQAEDAAARQEVGHALEWAALLSGSDAIRKLSLDRARSQLIEWWAAHAGMDAAGFAAGCASLPASFLTTGFSGEVRFFTRILEKLELLLQRLNRGEIAMVAAMTQAAGLFGRDRTQLYRWKRMLDGLPGLLRWAPEFERARMYLDGACPSTRSELQTLRRELLASAGEPLRFLESSARDAFDRSFQAFKQAYIEYYCALHDRMLHLADRPGTEEAAVDSVALRNLELLSSLSHTDQSYLNRVRIMGRWIQANQCTLPVRQILARVPRCYCNFNPMDTRHLGDFVAQINAVISEGIEYFRGVLRGCKSTIIRELRERRIDDHHARQIAALLSQGAMVPLKPRAVEVLNQAIQRHRKEFLAEIRRHA